MTRCAIRRHMQCSKQPVNLGAFGQIFGSLTDYNLASADEDDLRVLQSIAPSHHGYIVEINPNGLCFEIGALHPRCHCRSLFLARIDPASIQIALAIYPQEPLVSYRSIDNSPCGIFLTSDARPLWQDVWRISFLRRESTKGRPKPPELICTVPCGTKHSYADSRVVGRKSQRRSVHCP
jgi:hypothetical protein